MTVTRGAVENFKLELQDSCARIICAAEQELASANYEAKKRKEDLDERERALILREADVDRRERILQAKEDNHLLPMTPTPARAGARFSPRLPLQATQQTDDYGLSPVLFSSTKSGQETLESFCIPSPLVTESELDTVEVGSCHRLKAMFERRDMDTPRPTARRTGGPSQTIAATAAALQAAVTGNATEGRKPRVTMQELLRQDEERLSVY